MSIKFYFDIGKVVLSDDECFWIFPHAYIDDDDCRVLTHSPCFSYFSQKWRLVIDAPRNYSDVSLYLWNVSCRDVLNYSYTTKFKMMISNGTEQLVSRKGDSFHNYGFGVDDFCRKDYIYGSCGLIKIFFEIKEKCNLEVIPSHITNSKNEVDDINRKEEITSEDESSSENEISLDDEENEKKNVSSKIKGIKILSENLKQVFFDGHMSDAVLKVDDRKFNVHKVILFARSPVFASMFQHDMAEKKNNVVAIPDCTAESFEVFLLYLYSGNIETLSASNVYNVYYAADKYRVEDLKEKCVKFMMKNISVETFCDIIALSLRHGESKLQKLATDFFRENIKKIIKTVQWQKYMDDNSTQANELLIKALNA